MIFLYRRRRHGVTESPNESNIDEERGLSAMINCFISSVAALKLDFSVFSI